MSEKPHLFPDDIFGCSEVSYDLFLVISRKYWRNMEVIFLIKPFQKNIYPATATVFSTQLT